MSARGKKRSGIDRGVRPRVQVQNSTSQRKQPQSKAAERWAAALAALIIAMLTTLAYSNAAPSVFVHDDKLTVPPNIDRGLAALPQVFTEPAWAAANTSVPTYRPLLVSTFVIEGQLWRDRPRAMHWTNIALHVIATLVVFGLLEELRARATRDRPHASLAGLSALLPSALAALIFGVHPIHTEIVDSVFNRSEILSTIGVVSALWAVMRWADSRPVLAWGSAALLYFVGLLSRESAAMLPPLLVLVLGLLRFEGSWRARARRLAPGLVLAAPLGLYLLLRYNALSATRASLARALPTGAAADTAWWLRLEQIIVTLRESTRMIIWPDPLRCSYADLPVAGVVASFLLLALFIGCAIAVRREAPAVAVGVGFFYLALIPSTRVFANPGTVELAAERYVYLPSVGMAIALMGGFTVLARRVGVATLSAFGVLLVAVLGWLTFRRNVDWHSQEALWRKEVSVSPRDGDAWMQLTTELIRIGQPAKVAALCSAHLAENSEHAQFHNNCATAAMRTGHFPEAEALFRRSVELGAGSVGHANLARMLARIDRLQDAQVEYQAAVDAEINEAMRHVRRGEMILRLQPDHLAEARAEFQAALAIDPSFGPAQQWLERAGGSG